MRRRSAAGDGGTGGIADIVPELVEAIDKETGSAVMYETDPERLVDRAVDHYVNVHFRRPSVFVRQEQSQGPPVAG